MEQATTAAATEVIEQQTEVFPPVTQWLADADTLDLRRLAELGATVRLQQLDKERALILRTFPMLASEPTQGDWTRVEPKAQRWSTAQREKFAATMERKYRRTRLTKDIKGGKTLAEREAISKRMRAYWRQRRKEA